MRRLSDPGTRQDTAGSIARTSHQPAGVELLEPRLLFSAMPLITEFLASNNGGLEDEDGERSDWIELFNAGDTALDLAGWHLTDNSGDLSQWAFPPVVLEPDAFLVVFASGKDRAASGSELHTNFKLGAGGEYLALVEADGLTVAHEYAPDFPEQQADTSYGLTMTSVGPALVAEGSMASYIVPDAAIVDWNTLGFDDSAWAQGATGIGYEGSPGGSPNFTELVETELPYGTTSVYLRQTFNVANPSAISTLALNVRYDDGFVAYLNGTLIESDNAPGSPDYDSAATGSHSDHDAVDLQPFDITDHIGLLVAGENVLAIQGLNRPGSSDYLIEPELVATVTEVVTPLELGYFSAPTPGALNGQSYLGFVDDTAFSIDRGFYTTPISVAITTDTPGASIAYTLDGSAPTTTLDGVITNGTLYTGELNITGTETVRAIGFKPYFQSTNIDTHTYLFPADVINQDEAYTLAQGFPTLWDDITPDYGVDASDVDNAAFLNALTAIPTISINLDAEELFGVDGIYTNTSQHGKAWERAASIELISPDGSVGFQEDAGLRIQGGAFRSHNLSKKHSLRLIFRNEYGPGKLDFPLFGADAADEFNTITLRMDSNDGWSWSDADAQPQYARDEFGRQTQLAMGHVASHGTRAHVYLNGVYWGLYNPVERPDADFAASYYGGDPDNWDAINSGEATDGDLDAWDTLVSLAQDVASAGDEAARTAAFYQLQGKNPDGSNNPLWENYLDTENYIDYLLTNFYSGNGDWPFKNYYMARERGIDSTGFKFHMWDSEWSLGLRSSVNTNRLNDTRGVAEPYGDLRDSAEFRLLFADRAHRALFNDGALTSANAVARYQSIIAEIDSAIVGEVARWGDQHVSPGYTKADWLAESADVINDFLTGRTGVFLTHLRNAGLYASVDAVAWNQRGGTFGAAQAIELSAPDGTIYYTTDGSDPRLVGGAVSGSATAYTGGFTLPDHTTVRARVLHNGEWSAIDQADFVIADAVADATNLRIAEVHYNPADPSATEQLAGFSDAEQFEFIELVNTSSQTISLDGVELKRTVAGSELDGVTYEFGLVTLAPGERIIVVNDSAAFTQRYGTGINVAGQYAGNLANSGEFLYLTDAAGNTIQQFKYEDGSGAGEESWPATPDGDGPSLVVVDTDGDYEDGINWAASLTPHGTPGLAFDGDATGDGYVGSADLNRLLAYWGQPATANPQADAADLNYDGTVNAPDMALVMANWGAGNLPTTPTSNPDRGDVGGTEPDPGTDAGAGDNSEPTTTPVSDPDPDPQPVARPKPKSAAPILTSAPEPSPRKPPRDAQEVMSPQAQRAAATRQTADALNLARPGKPGNTSANTATPTAPLDKDAGPRRFNALSMR